MSSKILQSLPVDNKWLNLAFQEGCKRAPINIRPLLLVEQRQNHQGTALFSLAYSNLYDLTGRREFAEESSELSDWLLDNRIEGHDGYCGAHPHEIQDLSKKTSAHTADVVSTSYGVKALLQTPARSSKYEQTARTAADFLRNDLEYSREPVGASINYKPCFSPDHVTLNANALGARLLLDIYERFEERSLLNLAENLLRYVADKQTHAGGWVYREPPDASHVSMDNYHNGFIIESFLRHRELVGRSMFGDTLDTAVQFYRDQLYEDTGAPRWDEQHTYPRDIHAAAQGIVTFTKANRDEFAERVLDWTIENLYAGDGQFYYQQTRWQTKRFTLMRWCQAWMSYALSVYLQNHD
jgi:uncharacterized protein YyaL (SSP411 family)